MITAPAVSPADLEPTWQPPTRTTADVALDWRNEQRVFAAEELGWLGDEARRGLHRQSGLAGDYQVLRDLHRVSRGFALLAAHPRLLRRAAALLDCAVEIDGAFVHCGSLVQPGLPARADLAVVIVPLGWRAEAPLGGISFGTRPDRQARYEWPFVTIFRPLRMQAPAIVADDCLWPDASMVAG